MTDELRLGDWLRFGRWFGLKVIGLFWGNILGNKNEE